MFQVIAPADDKSLASDQFISLRKLFSKLFPVKTVNSELSQWNTTETKLNDSSESGTSQCSAVIDLTKGVQVTQGTIPTLNGYLFRFPWILYTLCHNSTKIVTMEFYVDK